MLSISLLDTPNSSNLVSLFNFEISFILDLLVSVIHVFTVESNNNVFKLTKSSKAVTSANSLCSKFRYSKFIILLAKLTLFILAAPRFSDFNFTRFSNSFTFIGSALNKFKYSRFVNFAKGERSFIPWPFFATFLKSRYFNLVRLDNGEISPNAWFTILNFSRFSAYCKPSRLLTLTPCSELSWAWHTSGERYLILLKSLFVITALSTSL